MSTIQPLPTVPASPALHPPHSTLDTLRFQHLCELVVEGMQRDPIPGVTMGVFHDEQEQIAAFGVTNVEHPLPVSEDTLFQVGSISKTFTATAIMRLVELGKLELDTPLRTYLPSLRLADEEVAARVTLRHVLTHTGGWVGDYFNDYGPDSSALARIIEDLASLPQLTPLGETWSYSNSGFYLAGRAIEAATGQSYEAAVQELVFKPLGLEHCYFFAHDLITYRFVVGHEVVDKQPKVARPWGIGRAGHSVGGLVTNIRDLFRYARFHMGDGRTPDGTRLLSPASLALMQTPQISASGLDWMGISWFITSLEGHKILRHGGATKGQLATLTLVPAENFAYVMLTNSDEGENLAYEVRKAALKEFLGITLPEALPVEMPIEKLAEVVGHYDSAMATCELALKEGGLWLQVYYKGGFPTPADPPSENQPPAVRIAFYGEDRVVGLDDPFKAARCEILRGADGQIAWFRLGSRLHRRDH